MHEKVITIGRQYGSGGHEIGRRLAERLGIPCYDKELLAEVAKNGHFSEQILEQFDERGKGSLLYSLVMGYDGALMAGGQPLSLQIFLAQFNTIRTLANQGSCIFIGRCADYALRERDRVLSVFLHAPEQVKIQRICRLYELTEKKAREKMLRTDKDRSSYYNYYTNQSWGGASNYNLCLDTSVFGIDGTIDVLADLYARMP